MLLLLATALVALVIIGVTVAVNQPDAAMSEEERDRPEIGLPDDREMTPDDVDQVRFSVALRGYRMSDVDEALDRLRLEIAARDARIRHLESAAPTESAEGDVADAPADVPDGALGLDPGRPDLAPPG